MQEITMDQAMDLVGFADGLFSAVIRTGKWTTESTWTGTYWVWAHGMDGEITDIQGELQ